MDEPQRNPDKHVTDDKQASGHGKTKTPPFVGAEPNEGTKPSGNCHCCCNKNDPPKESAWRKAGTIAEFVLAVALAVATGVNAYYVGQQWDAMTKTLTATNNLVIEAQKQAKAAQDAVATAQESIALNRDTFERSQRPWVIYRGIGGTDKPPKFGEKFTLRPIGQTLPIGIYFVNDGASPAFDVHPFVTAKILDRSHGPPCDLVVTEGNETRAVLGRGQEPVETTAIVDHWVKGVEKDLGPGGRSRLYVYGIVKYRDQFNKDRHTQFCLEHQPENIGPGFVYCTCGNKLD